MNCSKQISILAMPHQSMIVKIDVDFDAVKMALHGNANMRFLLADAIAAFSIQQPAYLAELLFNFLDLRRSEINMSSCVGDFHEL